MISINFFKVDTHLCKLRDTAAAPFLQMFWIFVYTIWDTFCSLCRRVQAWMDVGGTPAAPFLQMFWIFVYTRYGILFAVFVEGFRRGCMWVALLLPAPPRPAPPPPLVPFPHPLLLPIAVIAARARSLCVLSVFRKVSQQRRRFRYNAFSPLAAVMFVLCVVPFSRFWNANYLPHCWYSCFACFLWSQQQIRSIIHSHASP